METHWNGSATSMPIDPTNPDHMRLAWNELDTAVEAGARTIGLDAFAHTLSPLWNLRPVLVAARLRHPGVKFVTEGRSCDVLHLIAPTWVDGYRAVPALGRPERVPVVRFEIADYLVPLHETWVGMQFDRSRDPQLWGPNSSLNAQMAEIDEVARLGYVPVSWITLDMRGPSAP